MGLSNFLPSSRIAQSGVIPDTASRPASPYEGQMLYQKDTNQVLVWDGSAWVMIADTDSPSGLQLIKTQAVGTAVASITVTGAFTDDFENYKITLSGGTASAGHSIAIALGSSTTGYYGFLVYGDVGSTTVSGAVRSNTASLNWVGGASTASESTTVVVDVIAPKLARYTRFIGGQFVESTGYFGTMQGEHRVATAYSDFTLSPTTGTFTGGTVRVYGYRNTI